MGHTCWPIWPTDPQDNMDVTHIWPTCDPQVEVFSLKVANVRNTTWKIFDMEQCHRFLHFWQDTELVPSTDFLNMKSLDTTCFKTAWDTGFTPMIFQCIHQTVSSLTYYMPILFSKEHVISRSHPDNLACRWEPLDLSKSNQSDPDCLGHLTHLHPDEHAFCILGKSPHC